MKKKGDHERIQSPKGMGGDFILHALHFTLQLTVARLVNSLLNWMLMLWQYGRIGARCFPTPLYLVKAEIFGYGIRSG